MAHYSSCSPVVQVLGVPFVGDSSEPERRNTKFVSFGLNRPMSPAPATTCYSESQVLDFKLTHYAGGTVGIVIEESGVTWINLCGEFGYTFGEEEEVKNNTRLMTYRIPMELCNNFRVGQRRDGIH